VLLNVQITFSVDNDTEYRHALTDDVAPMSSSKRPYLTIAYATYIFLRFKLASLVYKVLNTGHPPYLTDLLQYHKPAGSMRSSASHLLSVPPHNLSFGAGAFRVAAPKIWNSIPLHIRQFQIGGCEEVWRRHLSDVILRRTSFGQRPP